MRIRRKERKEAAKRIRKGNRKDAPTRSALRIQPKEKNPVIRSQDADDGGFSGEKNSGRKLSYSFSGVPEAEDAFGRNQ